MLALAKHAINVATKVCSFCLRILHGGVAFYFCLGIYFFSQSLPCVCSEWYGYHFPELIKIVPDNSMYCRLAQLIGNRKELSEESLESLEEVVMDSAKAQAILDASRSSMGQQVNLFHSLHFYKQM